MPKEGRITNKQIIILIVLSRIIIGITYHPGLNEPPRNQDIWLSDLIFVPLQLLFSLPIYLLWKRFPSQTIIQYSSVIAGKLGKLAGVLILFYFINQTALSFAQFSLFLTSVSMPETPILFFTFTLVLVCGYAARKGLEVIGRLTELFAPIVLIAMLTVVFLITKDMNLKMLTPVFETRILSVFHGSFIYVARSFEVLALAMLLPYLNDRQKVRQVFILSFSLEALLFIIITLPILSIFGVEEAKKQTFAFYALIRLINIGDILERIESLHIAIWTLGTFIKLSFYYYLIVLGLSQLLNLRDYRPLILPIGTILIPYSLIIAPNLVELQAFTSYKIYAWYSLFFVFLIPICLLFLAIIRKKGASSQ